MKLPTTPVNSAMSWDQCWIEPFTCLGPKMGTDSGIRIGPRSQCVLLSCEVPDSRGAAAARLLDRITLDPLSGSTQVYRVFSGSCGFRSTGVYR